MAVIDDVVDLLSDHEWHDKGEIEKHVASLAGGYSSSVARKLREYSTIPTGQGRPNPFIRNNKRLYLMKKPNDNHKGTSYKLEERNIYDIARELNSRKENKQPTLF